MAVTLTLGMQRFCDKEAMNAARSFTLGLRHYTEINKIDMDHNLTSICCQYYMQKFFTFVDTLYDAQTPSTPTRSENDIHEFHTSATHTNRDGSTNKGIADIIKEFKHNALNFLRKDRQPITSTNPPEVIREGKVQFLTNDGIHQITRNATNKLTLANLDQQYILEIYCSNKANKKSEVVALTRVKCARLAFEAENPNNDSVFVIELIEGAKFIVRCPSANDVDEWVNVIEEYLSIMDQTISREIQNRSKDAEVDTAGNGYATQEEYVRELEDQVDMDSNDRSDDLLETTEVRQEITLAVANNPADYKAEDDKEDLSFYDIPQVRPSVLAVMPSQSPDPLPATSILETSCNRNSISVSNNYDLIRNPPPSQEPVQPNALSFASSKSSQSLPITSISDQNSNSNLTSVSNDYSSITSPAPSQEPDRSNAIDFTSSKSRKPLSITPMFSQNNKSNSTVVSNEYASIPSPDSSQEPFQPDRRVISSDGKSLPEGESITEILSNKKRNQNMRSYPIENDRYGNKELPPLPQEGAILPAGELYDIVPVRSGQDHTYSNDVQEEPDHHYRNFANIQSNHQPKNNLITEMEMNNFYDYPNISVAADDGLQKFFQEITPVTRSTTSSGKPFDTPSNQSEMLINKQTTKQTVQKVASTNPFINSKPPSQPPFTFPTANNSNNTSNELVVVEEDNYSVATHAQEVTRRPQARNALDMANNQPKGVKKDSIKKIEAKSQNSPVSYEVKTTLLHCSCYFVKVSRSDAGQYCLGGQPAYTGTFLIRQSESGSGFALTFNCEGNIKHLRLSLDAEERWNIENFRFNDIFELIHFFRVRPVPFDKTKKETLLLRWYACSDNPMGKPRRLTAQIIDKWRQFSDDHLGRV
ncbi:SH2B adapter protein 1 [Trichoplax sp. H2]|nr:SH2B adapter protein 1 [Trichoplax sp. H2]|eukprot:RDD38039.1 SH2B adapter protein 1 [Trichoplax sp. H2]